MIPQPQRRRLAFALLSTAVGLALLYGAVRHIHLVPDDLRIAWWGPLAYCAIVSGYHLLRGIRWHVLLRALAPIRPRESLPIAFVGFLWTVMLPIRLGELVRPLLLARRAEIGLSRAVGTVAIERVIDALVICGLFFGSRLLEGRPAGDRGGELEEMMLGASLLGWALFGAASTVFLMALFPARLGRLVAATVSWFSSSLAGRVERIGTELAEGMAALSSTRSLLSFVVLTACYWGMNAGGMWLLAQACDLPLHPHQAVLLMSVLGLSLLLPSAPGSIGPFQLGIAIGLGASLDATTVSAGGSVFAFYLYASQQGVATLFGLWGHHRLGLGPRRLVRALSRPPPSQQAGL